MVPVPKVQIDWAVADPLLPRSNKENKPEISRLLKVKFLIDL